MYNVDATGVFHGVRKGSWTDDEDELLRKCVEKFGEGNWHRVPQRAGLNRCRKSCRLRWMNYLKPNIKRGQFSEDEIDLILRLHKLLGNRWALIAGRIPGRTANDVKNYWNTHLLKKFSSSRLPRHRKILNKDNDCMHGNSHEANKTVATSSNTKTQVIKPQPRTFLRTPYSLPKMPHQMTMMTGPTSGPINGPYESPNQCNYSQQQEEKDDDYDTSWLDSFLLDVQDDDNMPLEDACNMKQFHGPELGPRTGLGLGFGPRTGKVQGCERPSNQGESTWLPSSLNEMPPQPKQHLWEDDHFWDFDVSLWQ